jgi:HlyD family secretion protein
MLNRSKIIVIVALLLALGAGGFAWFRMPPPVAAGLAWLGIGRPVVDAKLTLYGDVDIREAHPAFNDSGPITRMMVQEGASVKCGDLLATLDDTRYAASLAQAKAQMQNAHETLARLLAGSRPEEISQVQATMDALEATFRNNEVNYQRSGALVVTNAGTIKNRDDAKAAFDAARQQYEAARQAWILAVKGPREEDIAAARAAYRAAQAAVALAQKEFDDTRLYAPADGVVEDRILEPGDMATPATPVYTIALPSPLWVRAYVPESNLGHVRLGMAAEISSDSFPGHLYHGWIGYLSPTAEFTPKTVETPELRTALVYQLRVYVCDARGQLRLGMPATVRINPAQTLSEPPPGCFPSDDGR